MSARWIVGLSRVRVGDRIEAWSRKDLHHVGTVSQVAPHLGVLWILEASSAIPKLIPFREFRLRHAPGARAA